MPNQTLQQTGHANDARSCHYVNFRVSRHGLRGKLSNHQPDPKLPRAVLAAYRQHYADFGPTFASEKLAEQGLHVNAQTLPRWLIAEGLGQRQRRREASVARTVSVKEVTMSRQRTFLMSPKCGQF